jgi:uncharacterized protein (TIGR03000 family)
MFRRIFALSKLAALAMLGAFLVPQPAAAQLGQGQNLYQWSGGGLSGGSSYGGRGGRSGSYFVPRSPAYYDYAPAYTASPPVTRSQAYYSAYYYAPDEASPVNETVTMNVTVPADAKIWFDNAPTAQTGQFRRFVSPTITPGKDYVYTVRASWTERGHKVERTKDIAVHAGDLINLDFTTERLLTNR